VKHKKRNNGTFTYLVKWENYPPEENSWVDQDDLNALELLEKYWASKNPPPSKSKNSSNKASSRTSKSTEKKQQSSKDVSTSKKRRSPMDSDNENAVKSSPRKARRTDSTSQNHQNASNRKSAAQKSARTSKTSSSKNRFQESENDSDQEESRIKSFHPAQISDWENLVDRVETIEQADDDKFLVHLIWKNGTNSSHPRSEVNRKCPQKMLSFYEQHLRFKPIE